MNDDLDKMFSNLIAEGQAAKRRPGRPRTATKSAPGGSADRLEILRQKKIADLATLTAGKPVEGWRRECILVRTVHYQCEWCGQETEALNASTVFLVVQAVRRPTTKHMRPIRSGELPYLYTTGLPVRREHMTTTVPCCQNCVHELEEKQNDQGNESDDHSLWAIIGSRGSDQPAHLPGGAGS